MKENNRNNQNLKGTLADYRNRGWKTVPVWGIQDGSCTCGKDCAKPGKHPVHSGWSKQGAPENTWQRQENLNVAIQTGTVSGLVVLDIDGTEGEESLAAILESKGESLPRTLTVKTGRGRHLYFRCVGPNIRSSNGSLARKIDVRGEGGYVIAPPSTHASGRQYSFVDADTEVAEAPEWLLGMLESPRGQNSSTQRSDVCPASTISLG